LPAQYALRDQVDQLLLAQKEILGAPEWNTGAYSGQYRWLAPLGFGGTVTPLNLIVDAFPRSDDLHFNILITHGRCVMRLEYWSQSRHNNHRVGRPPLPAGIPAGWIRGPHCHHWRENRALATARTLPIELEFAAPLPVTVRGFHAAFRWFCGEANIICASNQEPNLPTSDTLL